MLEFVLRFLSAYGLPQHAEPISDVKHGLINTDMIDLVLSRLSEPETSELERMYAEDQHALLEALGKRFRSRPQAQGRVSLMAKHAGNPPGCERRVALGKRRRVAEMSPEEMRRELLTSEVTGLPNRRAFGEAGAALAVAMSDVDGLKALNKYGYEAGNAVLKAKADALREAGLEAYHDKGDEFLCRGNHINELLAKLERARAILRDQHDSCGTGRWKYSKHHRSGFQLWRWKGHRRSRIRSQEPQSRARTQRRDSTWGVAQYHHKKPTKHLTRLQN